MTIYETKINRKLQPEFKGGLKPEDLTPKQREALGEVLKQTIRHQFIDLDDRSIYEAPSSEYELKQFTVERLGEGYRDLFVCIQVGRKNDSGTMGAVFGRDHRLLVIGAGGRIELRNTAKKRVRGTAAFYTPTK